MFSMGGTLAPPDALLSVMYGEAMETRMRKLKTGNQNSSFLGPKQLLNT
jgi:hypothetical protein